MTLETIGDLWLLVITVIAACMMLLFIIWLIVIWLKQGGDREIAGLFLIILIPIFIVCVITILWILGVDIFVSIKTYFDTPL